VFIDGCERTGYGRDLGTQLFGVIRKFADYAFNKSHTFGYGLISYQTAYLKAHHPVEYLACLLTSVKGNYDKMPVFLADARSFGITVMTPDVNVSESDFTAVTSDGKRIILFGLSAVRNVGEGLVQLILDERKANGPFGSFHEFCDRVPDQALNKRAVESLIKAGAFDNLGHQRKGLLLVHEAIIDNAIVSKRERERGIMSLFGEVDDSAGSGWSDRIDIPEETFGKSDKLRHEKEMLGLYVSDHPLAGYESALRRRVESTIADLESRGEGMVSIGGVVTNLSRRFTRKGDQMATFVLEDMEASTEVTVFARTLAQYGHMLADDVIVTVFGRLNKSDERSSFTAQRIELVEDLEQRIPEVLVTLPQGFTQDSLGTLQEIIREYPGTSPVKISLSTGMVFDTGDRHLVDADKVIGPLRVNFGANSVRII
jgi:DNA polymerase-3 subunit alpha